MLSVCLAREEWEQWLAEKICCSGPPQKASPTLASLIQPAIQDDSLLNGVIKQPSPSIVRALKGTDRR